MTITFRPDTSFPYLKIAREGGVPYAKVLHIVEVLETGATPSASPAPNPLVLVIQKAFEGERARRQDLEAARP
jgi:hypothetical protein